MSRPSRCILVGCLGFALTRCTTETVPPAPRGYPQAYFELVEKAEKEGGLLIWSAVDRQKAAPLLAAFHGLYPEVAVRYLELPAGELNARFIKAADHGAPVPDLLWSSAMDLQIKLVNDGYTQRYASPERRHLPGWANWKNQAWGTTAEPIVFVYNRRLIDDATVPRDHMSLVRFLENRPLELRGKVATYDLPSSAVGYLYLSQDEQATHDVWRLVRAMAVNQVHIFKSAEEVLRDVAAGRSAIGYDIVGSYVASELERNPQLGMVLPRDYTLVMSRIAVIPAAAPHPNAARIFLDFLLSRRGQQMLAEQRIPSVRSDVSSLAALHPQGAPFRAIRVGPALLVDSDRLTREYFLRRWRQSLAVATPSS